MAKANRICHTCLKEYYHCPTCPSTSKKEVFYNMFCSERCSKIFKTLTDETFKRLTVEQCKEKLNKLDVSLNEKFKDGIKKHIERIMNTETVVEVKGVTHGSKVFEDLAKNKSRKYCGKERVMMKIEQV